MVRGVEIWVGICLIGASFLCYLDVLRFVNFQRSGMANKPSENDIETS